MPTVGALANKVELSDDHEVPFLHVEHLTSLGKARRRRRILHQDKGVVLAEDARRAGNPESKVLGGAGAEGGADRGETLRGQADEDLAEGGRNDWQG